MGGVSLISFILVVELISIGLVYAGSYPERPIMIVNPWGAGGLSDNILMVIRAYAPKYIPQTIIVSLKPGATATVGHKYVAESSPDGYTLIFTSTGPRTIVPQFREVPYDPLKDFTNICRLANIGQLLSVRADFPAKDFKEFLDYAKNNPGKVKVGMPGTEGTGYIAFKELALKAKLDLIHVPFHTTADSVTACAGGKTDAVIISATAIRPMVEAGKIRPLVSTGSTRPSLYPDVKTYREFGVNAAVDDSYGLAGPSKLPVEITNYIQNKIKEILIDPKVIESFEKIGAPISYLDSIDFTRVMEEDYANYKKLIKGE